MIYLLIKSIKNSENKDKKIDEQRREIENKDKTIDDQLKEIENKNKTIDDQNKEIKNKNKTIDDQNKEIEENEKYVYTNEIQLELEFYKGDSKGSITSIYEIPESSSYRICVFGAKAKQGGYGGKQCGEYYFENLKEMVIMGEDYLRHLIIMKFLLLLEEEVEIQKIMKIKEVISKKTEKVNMEEKELLNMKEEKLGMLIHKMGKNTKEEMEQVRVSIVNIVEEEVETDIMVAELEILEVKIMQEVEEEVPIFVMLKKQKSALIVMMKLIGRNNLGMLFTSKLNKKIISILDFNFDLLN